MLRRRAAQEIVVPAATTEMIRTAEGTVMLEARNTSEIPPSVRESERMSQCARLPSSTQPVAAANKRLLPRLRSDSGFRVAGLAGGNRLRRRASRMLRGPSSPRDILEKALRRAKPPRAGSFVTSTPSSSGLKLQALKLQGR